MLPVPDSLMLALSRAFVPDCESACSNRGDDSPQVAGAVSRFPNWQFLILAALTLWLYWHTLVRLFQQWGNDQNFSHGYFVPLFSGFVIWQERDRLSRIRLRPSWSGLLLVVLGLVVLILGQMGVELFLMRSSLLILAAGLVVLFGAGASFGQLFFPWAFLFLMIPIPAIIFNQITFPLQILASQIRRRHPALVWSARYCVRET